MSWKQTLNKPTAKPAAPKPKFDTKDDDWDTDLTYENSVTEKSQRYGSESVPGSGRVDHIDFNTIQEKVKAVDGSVKEAYREKNPTRGYGGKYGTEKVMDKAAEDFSYKADIQKHSSQTDGKKGFGGEHGVDERAKDKSAVGFDYKATVEKHSSQTDSSKGFGGKFGTDQNVQDQSAVGFSHKETLPKHSSQTDYSAGFGGKYGVQKEDSKSAPTVASPTPPVAEPKIVEKSDAPSSAKADVGNIRARFENMKKEKEDETTKRVAEERKKRTVNEQYLQNSNTSDPVKKKEDQKVSSTVKGTPPARPKTPTVPEVSTSNSSESEVQTLPSTADAPVSNVSEDNEETVQVSSSTKDEESTRLVDTINVTSLLRPRKTSSSSSSSNDNDEEDQWAS